jgi:hypothetical protein
LAVALDGLMTHRGGLWFGWSGAVNDVVQDAATIKTFDAPGGGSMCFATIDLTQDEHDRYYNAFSNATLWPLLHSMPEQMCFDRRNAQVYRETNARLTDALLPLLKANDLIWVHDYHLMAMPALLRARGVTAPIGFFLHVPFPSSDLLASELHAAAFGSVSSQPRSMRVNSPRLPKPPGARPKWIGCAKACRASAWCSASTGLIRPRGFCSASRATADLSKRGPIGAAG